MSEGIGEADVTTPAATQAREQADSDDENKVVQETKKLPSRGKAKPKSFLDEILAERSKKKQNKKSGNP